MVKLYGKEAAYIYFKGAMDNTMGIRVLYQGDFWTVLDQAEYVTIVNERSGRVIQVLEDLLEIAR